MKKVQQGFTLIELMIVVAIIGILAAIAIPAYQDYTIRAKVSEVIGLASATKTTLYEYYSTEGEMPLDANVSVASDSAGVLNNSKYVTDGTATYARNATNIGQFTVTLESLGSGANGETMVFVYDASSGFGLDMTCNTGSLGDKFLPTTCK